MKLSRFEIKLVIAAGHYPGQIDCSFEGARRWD